MWIAGLDALSKPFVHLHTQFNRDIPWSTIDMDFMNLNQSAHGGREFGFICSRMRLARKVVVGHWQDEDVLSRLETWVRAACAVARRSRSQDRPVRRQHARSGRDRRRQGRGPNATGLLGQRLRGGRRGRVCRRRHRCGSRPACGRVRADGTRVADSLGGSAATCGSRCAMRPGSSWACGRFFDQGDFEAFTDTFENLHGLKQLPGIAVQRLMADGLRLWGRRRLEDGGAGAGDEGHGGGAGRRHVVHGGLHVPFRSRPA